ncbi:hypothetical protein [Neptunomonas antarctica]|uniref:Uncharacterized protein n=1 Tax=Neptunomonas antarctica TaxID=619304 RepID=A0A1N7MNJ9_9GAMM|nr:hypothetical protein [Neptunomonas antarctica]SIS87677.1 hypothetical protein SAMN05421760_106222 [Neptunomonas antarctica]
MIELEPIGWRVRYNADGHTFSASCEVINCLNETVEVHMGMSLTPGAFMRFRVELRKEFAAMGYRVARYMHNGRVIEEQIV